MATITRYEAEQIEKAQKVADTALSFVQRFV
jgi:hypothetical protein